MNFYERILNYYYELLTEEEFLKKTHEWSLRYIQYKNERAHLHQEDRQLNNEREDL